MHRLWIGLVCLVLVGCGGQTVVPTITPRPTLTVTPLSTPLGDVATPVPSGTGDNPLQMVLVPVNSTAARRVRADFEAALLNLTGVSVKLTVAQRDTEAVAAVCDSLETVSMAWVDSLGYAQAMAKGCGQAVLRIAPSRNSMGESGVIVFAPSIESTALGDLTDNTFCRIGVTDFYTWLLPSLMMRSVGMSPDTLDSVRDYESSTAILEAMVAGECDATAFAATEFDRLVESDDPLVADVSVSTTSPEFPPRILLMSSLVPLPARDALIEALLEWRDADLITPLVGEGDIMRVETGDLDALNDFFRATGYDFSIIGQ